MNRNIILFMITCMQFFIFPQTMIGQQVDCSFKAPILKIDFGSAAAAPGINIGYLSNYRQTGGSCPQDGNYSFAAYTGNCFDGDWITMNEDHTPGDYEGKMMIVNASVNPGTFFQYALGNLTPNTTYEFSAWIVNVCRTSSPCNPTPPSISFIIQNSNGSQLAKFKTGVIAPTNGPNWQRYFGEFYLAAGTTGIIIRMNDETTGGCGNDFALDDIMLRECTLRKSVIKDPIKPVVTIVNMPTAPVSKPVEGENKPTATATTPSIVPVKKNIPFLSREEIKGKPVQVKSSIKDSLLKVPVPEVLITRSNPVVKHIETGASEMLIELYDNGEIDGDTVTIYDNNMLLVSRAGLSEKPVSFKIKIDALHPHHELVMVANNLGSIPPNTSLMVITANDKRYEMFISSSEQKNAMVEIDLKE